MIDFNTGRNLAKVVTDTLAEYGLSMAQVITCTTDNGSNMLKMLDEFDVFTSDISTENTNIEIESDQTIEESNDQGLMDDINIREVPISDDDALDLIFDESSLFEDILEEMVNELQHQNDSQIFSVDSIRCAAYTLQLAVRDALDKISPNIKNVIELCSRVAKFLRCKNAKVKLLKAGIKTILPSLDVLTRWSSTYLMVSS